ncbi:hypothetical protein BDZ89DRAFT_765 [Hymenopellis radicata]|nr:hypothetical protein BDZ89DRAFT_765 [Hymenopellis radicata]
MTRPDFTPPTFMHKLSSRFVHVCNVLFYGLGIYVFILELIYFFNLMPPRLEVEVARQITIISYAIATGCYVVLMFWLSIHFFFLPLFRLKNSLTDEFLIDASVQTDAELPSTPHDSWKSRIQCCFAATYCIILIINDAVINRLYDSTAVEGGLTRVGEMIISSFDIYLTELFYLSLILLCYITYVLRRAYLAARQARQEQIDLENNIADVEFERLRGMVVEMDIIFDVEESEKFTC